MEEEKEEDRGLRLMALLTKKKDELAPDRDKSNEEDEEAPKDASSLASKAFAKDMMSAFEDKDSAKLEKVLGNLLKYAKRK